MGFIKKLSNVKVNTINSLQNAKSTISALKEIKGFENKKQVATAL